MTKSKVIIEHTHQLSASVKPESSSPKGTPPKVEPEGTPPEVEPRGKGRAMIGAMAARTNIIENKV